MIITRNVNSRLTMLASLSHWKPPLCAVQWVWKSASCGFICGSGNLFNYLQWFQKQKKHTNNSNKINLHSSWNVTNQHYAFCLAPAMWQLLDASLSLPCYQAKFRQYPCRPVLHCQAWTSPQSHENLSPIIVTASTSVSATQHNTVQYKQNLYASL